MCLCFHTITPIQKQKKLKDIVNANLSGCCGFKHIRPSVRRAARRLRGITNSRSPQLWDIGRFTLHPLTVTVN